MIILFLSRLPSYRSWVPFIFASEKCVPLEDTTSTSTRLSDESLRYAGRRRRKTVIILLLLVFFFSSSACVKYHTHTPVSKKKKEFFPPTFCLFLSANIKYICMYCKCERCLCSMIITSREKKKKKKV